jgi:hypothetical protein
MRHQASHLGGASFQSAGAVGVVLAVAGGSIAGSGPSTPQAETIVARRPR